MFYGAQLVEPGVSYFYNKTLQKCHHLKETHYNIYYNTIMLLGFIFIIGTLLYIRYKGKLSPIDQKMKQTKKHEYIMSKVRNYQDVKRQTTDATLITKLPEFDNEYELVTRKLYN